MPRKTPVEVIVRHGSRRVRCTNLPEKATLLASSHVEGSRAEQISDLYVGKNGTFYVLHYGPDYPNGATAMVVEGYEQMGKKVGAYEEALRIYNDYKVKIQEPAPPAGQDIPVDDA